MPGWSHHAKASANQLHAALAPFSTRYRSPFQYSHVLVKAAGGTWYAGTYTEQLGFEFEKQVFGPRAPKGTKQGDIWTGPHVGILYRLTADERDIYYKRTVRPGVERKELLSDHADATIVTDIARRMKQQGGRLYIMACERSSPGASIAVCRQRTAATATPCGRRPPVA